MKALLVRQRALGDINTDVKDQVPGPIPAPQPLPSKPEVLPGACPGGNLDLEIAAQDFECSGGTKHCVDAIDSDLRVDIQSPNVAKLVLLDLNDAVEVSWGAAVEAWAAFPK